ncbi:hypothetical protein L596_028178 [Steinernema carpocapsae]|uniref:Rab-GAP TBC domain-containing protein n=1 Tax=Steinernema carpocapsae TaxID=34508 RepID=A0A4U5LXN4_STECR|nr:hypothetical protein L596_028178 [Steinernema carpocapsae]
MCFHREKPSWSVYGASAAAVHCLKSAEKNARRQKRADGERASGRASSKRRARANRARRRQQPHSGETPTSSPVERAVESSPRSVPKHDLCGNVDDAARNFLNVSNTMTSSSPEYRQGMVEKMDRFPDAANSIPTQPRLPRISTAHGPSRVMPAFRINDDERISGISECFEERSELDLGNPWEDHVVLGCSPTAGDELELLGRLRPVLSALDRLHLHLHAVAGFLFATSASRRHFCGFRSAEDYMQKYHGRNRGERTISAGHVITPSMTVRPQGIPPSTSSSVPYRRASSSVVETFSRLPELDKVAPNALPSTPTPSYHYKPPPPTKNENVSMIDVPETDILDSSYSEDDDLRDKPIHSNRDRTSISSDMTDDSEFMELCERETIVEKYEAGPNSKEIESWENPEFELYRKKDRYGFIHKDETKQLEKTAAQLERRRILKEVQRAEKWAKLLKVWTGEQPASQKVSQRVWKGIPESIRSVAWIQLLGVNTMKMQARKNMYRDLLMRARLLSKDVKQIDLDINRTYRDPWISGDDMI